MGSCGLVAAVEHGDHEEQCADGDQAEASPGHDGLPASQGDAGYCHAQAFDGERDEAEQAEDRADGQQDRCTHGANLARAAWCGVAAGVAAKRWVYAAERCPRAIPLADPVAPRAAHSV
jgi:hypothetical protein